jgi:hypothetical protein
MLERAGFFLINVGVLVHLQTTYLLDGPMYSVEQPPHCDLFTNKCGD